MTGRTHLQALRTDRRRLVAGSLAAVTVAAVGRGGATAQDASPAGGDATAVIVGAANAFLDTLSETERDAVLFDWADTAQKQRWSNLPEGGFERAGLMWGNLSDAQRDAWLTLMQATLSADGYDQVIAEWTADDVLATEDDGGQGGQPANGGAPQGGQPPAPDGTPPDGGPAMQNGTPPGDQFPGGGGGLLFGTRYYWVAIIGTPSATDPWQWQWGGHHVTINATVVGPNLALSPSFIGVQPATYTDANGKTVRPLGAIEDDAFALVNSLDASQQQAAILGETPIDLVLGPGQDGRVIQPEGLAAAQMNADQQALLLALIAHYGGLAHDEAAAARMAEIESTLDETFFVWYGPTEEGSAAYFRVTGPTLVIEYAPQQMGGDAANHIHGIYRDPTNDYGARYTGITLES